MILAILTFEILRYALGGQWADKITIYLTLHTIICPVEILYRVPHLYLRCLRCLTLRHLIQNIRMGLGIWIVLLAPTLDGRETIIRDMALATLY